MGRRDAAAGAIATVARDKVGVDEARRLEVIGLEIKLLSHPKKEHCKYATHCGCRADNYLFLQLCRYCFGPVHKE